MKLKNSSILFVLIIFSTFTYSQSYYFWSPIKPLVCVQNSSQNFKSEPFHIDNISTGYFQNVRVYSKNGTLNFSNIKIIGHNSTAGTKTFYSSSTGGYRPSYWKFTINSIFRLEAKVSQNSSQCISDKIVIEITGSGGNTINVERKIKANLTSSCVEGKELYIRNRLEDDASEPDAWYGNQNVVLDKSPDLKNRLKTTRMKAPLSTIHETFDFFDNNTWDLQEGESLTSPHKTHEHPVFPKNQSNKNKLGVRIHNKTCIDVNSGKLRMYWNRARGWSYWPGGWHHYANQEGYRTSGGENDKNFEWYNHNGQKVRIPYGGQLTLSNLNNRLKEEDNKTWTPPQEAPKNISVKGGESKTIWQDWIPPRRKWFVGDNYGTDNKGNPGICLMARLTDVDEDPLNFQHGPKSNSDVKTIDYIRKNNQVVWRNSALYTIDQYEQYSGPYLIIGPDDMLGDDQVNSCDWSLGRRTMEINNPNDQALNVDLHLSNKSSYKDISYDNFGRVVLTMQDSLWSKWQESGANGSGVKVIEEQVVEVTDTEKATMNNIQLPANASGTEYNFGFTFGSDPITNP